MGGGGAYRFWTPSDSCPEGARSSQEVVGHGLLGGDAPGLLGRRLEDDELPLQVLVQLQDGRHVTAPGGGARRGQVVTIGVQ